MYHNNLKIERSKKVIDMAAAYSLDLRKKILSAWQNQEGSQRELAQRFKVSLAFIRNFLRRYRETGDIAPKPQGGDRRSKIQGKDEELLQKLVAEQNDIYLRELQGSILDRTGIEVSESSLCRQLKRLKLERKKNFNSQRTAF
jgi:transposase